LPPEPLPLELPPLELLPLELLPPLPPEPFPLELFPLELLPLELFPLELLPLELFPLELLPLELFPLELLPLELFPLELLPLELFPLELLPPELLPLELLFPEPLPLLFPEEEAVASGPFELFPPVLSLPPLHDATAPSPMQVIAVTTAKRRAARLGARRSCTRGNSLAAMRMTSRERPRKATVACCILACVRRRKNRPASGSRACKFQPIPERCARPAGGRRHPAYRKSTPTDPSSWKTAVQ